MTRGRKPKATALKALAGNPGKRKLNASEPKPDLVLPSAPAGLTDVGKAKWDEMSVLLFNQGILTEMDLQYLYFFCVEWETYVDAMKNMKAFGGPVVKTENGNPIQNPYLSVANQSKQNMYKILSLFGMSPADRSKVTAVSNAGKRAAPHSLAEKFFGAPVAVTATTKGRRK